MKVFRRSYHYWLCMAVRILSSILMTYITFVPKVNFFTSKEGVGVIESRIVM